MRTRIRTFGEIPPAVWNYSEKQYYANFPQNPPFSTYETRGALWPGKGLPISLQQTTDENHPQWRSEHPPTALDGDYGGNFTSYRKGVTVSDGRRRYCRGEETLSGIKTIAKYDSPFYAVSPTGVSFPTASLSNLAAKGTTAIARCKPTNNIADLGTAVGEIFHDGLPKLFGATLWEERTLAAKSSSEYLNLQFGWLPLVSDIKDVAYAAANAHRILSDYERNAGKVVRRRFDFPLEETDVVSTGALSDGWLFSPGWANSMTDTSKIKPQILIHTRTRKKVWFSGAFTYHLPSGYRSRNGLVSAAAKAGPLLGLELTPDVVWNLTPWSWAIDWFSNMGDVVSNISDWANDGLVLKYGYIMEHFSSSITYTLSGPSRYKFNDPYPASVTSYIEYKRRQAATPFGFEITWNGFSPRQLAITAALGILRVFR